MGLLGKRSKSRLLGQQEKLPRVGEKIGVYGLHVEQTARVSLSLGDLRLGGVAVGPAQMG